MSACLSWSIHCISLLIVLGLWHHASAEVYTGKPYCSFFANRAPKAQPNLSNCSWYREKSCCKEDELKIQFAQMKPLHGASPSCVRYLNFLMCYICSPDQHKFYSEERLKICVEFCNALYDACNAAILKGSVIKDVYSSGYDFCESRSFIVNATVRVPVSQRNCFYFDLQEKDWLKLFPDSGALMVGVQSLPPLTLLTGTLICIFLRLF